LPLRWLLRLPPAKQKTNRGVLGMTADDTVALNRLVGGLEAKIESFQSNWQEQDRRASEGRKFLYDKMEGLGRDVQGLTHQVTSVVHDVAEMKPAVTDWVNSKNQAMGARTAASILGRGTYLLIGGLVMAIGWALAHLPSIFK
jgi:hypothetical protein